MTNPIRAITDQQPPAFNFRMTDNGAVTFGAPVDPGALSFTDAGYMPITALTIAGDPQRLHGIPDSLFIQYSAQGVQHFAPNGVPTTADYTSLHFELVGYKGNASFGRAADGTATFSGGKHLTVLAQGDLIMGQLGFNAMGGITGQVSTSYKVDGKVVGTFDLSVQHTAAEITPTASGFTLSGGTLQATFLPLSNT